MVTRLVMAFLMMLFLLGVAIYFRAEFRFTTTQRAHHSGLENKFLQILDNKYNCKLGLPNDECIVDIYEAKEGFSFAIELATTLDHLSKICRSDCLNSGRFYQTNTRIVKATEPQKLWAYKENKFGDKVAGFILSREIKKITTELRKRRLFLSENYDKVLSNSSKAQLLDLVKLMDAKITDLEK